MYSDDVHDARIHSARTNGMHCLHEYGQCSVHAPYLANDTYATACVRSALRDTSYGWCVRGAHSNYASAVFLFMYLHATRAWMYAAVGRIHVAVWSCGSSAQHVYATSLQYA
jgi:hypothetical protein